MKIFAMDDYKRVINSEDYTKASMNYQFNMLENNLFKFGSVIQHILWTDKKIKQWQKERPQETTTEQFNEWLEKEFIFYKKILNVK